MSECRPISTNGLDLLREQGNKARAPVSKHIGDGLLECRARSGNQQARLIYFFMPGKRIVIVVAVMKDSRKLDRRDIKRAIQIKKQIEMNEGNEDEINIVH